MTLYFATYFDINYQGRGMVMFESLARQCTVPFRLFILALDDATFEYYVRNPDERITIIQLNTLEAYFPELKNIKTTRSKVEYYFTLSPFLPLYILDNFSYVHQVTTLDSDLYFFSDPAVIFNYYANASLLITPHHFPDKIKEYERFGLYNVSFQSFKNDVYARACLLDWKQKCSEWCFDYFDEKNSRFADQKYLDEWMNTFSNVQAINLPGAGLAPWNLESYNLSVKENKFFVNGEPLIFYHFHGLRILNENIVFPHLSVYKASIQKIIKKIYHPYLLQLKAKANDKKISDKKLPRNNNIRNKSPVKLLLEADDFLFFNSFAIYNFQLKPFYSKYQRLLKKLNGGINRFSNVYR